MPPNPPTTESRRSRIPRRALLWTTLTAAVLAGCSQTAPTHNPGGAQPRIETVSIRQQDLAQTIEMPGTVEGYETAELYAKVGGYLEEVFVDIGDRITQGQPLAKISVPEMLQQLAHKQAEIVRAETDVKQSRAAVRQTEAQLAAARAGRDEARTERSEKQAQWQFRQTEYRRVKELVDSGALLSQRMDEARFQLDAAESVLGSVEARIRTAEALLNVAQANLDKARIDIDGAVARVDVARADYEVTRIMLEYATIRAPFDGMVTRRWVHPGAFIQPAEGNSAAGPLLSVARTDKVRVLLDLPMAEIRLLNRGDPAVLARINALPGEKFEGRVTRFSSSLDATSRMMRVEVDLDNHDGRLLPGYYGYVTLRLQQYPKTPVVPSSALLADGPETFVFVVEDGICRKRLVTINYQDGTIVGIASGLRRGEQVVRAGGGQLTDGQQVIAVLAESGKISG